MIPYYLLFRDVACMLVQSDVCVYIRHEREHGVYEHEHEWMNLNLNMDEHEHEHDEHEHGDNEHVFSLVDHARHMQWLHGQNVTSCSLTIQLDFVFRSVRWLSSQKSKRRCETSCRMPTRRHYIVGSVRKIMQVLEHHGLACRQRLNCMKVGVRDANRDGLGVSAFDCHRLCSEISDIGYDSQEFKGVAIQL